MTTATDFKFAKPEDRPKAEPGTASNFTPEQSARGPHQPPMMRFMKEHPVVSSLAVAGLGVFGLAHYNLSERDRALSAPALDLGSVSSQVAEVQKFVEAGRLHRDLSAQLEHESWRPSDKPWSEVQTRERLAKLEAETSTSAPVFQAKIEAVAVFTNVTYSATYFKNAKENPTYSYVLSETNGAPTNIILQSEEQLSPDNKPVLVSFSTDLRTASNVEGKITLVPMDLPRLLELPKAVLGLPGTSDAILSIAPSDASVGLGRTRR